MVTAGREWLRERWSEGSPAGTGGTRHELRSEIPGSGKQGPRKWHSEWGSAEENGEKIVLALKKTVLS